MEIAEFIEICKWGKVDEVKEKLYSRKAFFLFRGWSRSSFINTLHDGESALNGAARSGNLDTVRFLLEHKAFVNITDGFGATPLISAAVSEKNAEVVQLLIDRGAKVDARQQGGSTALLQAALLGNIDIVRILLDNGATSDLPDEFGNTPMSAALQNNKLEVVAMLVAAKAGVVAQVANGESVVSPANPLSELRTNSKLLLDNVLPEICFVGAPFGNEPPKNISGWVEANRDLMIARVTGVEDENEFEALQRKIEQHEIRTILIPDISADEINGPILNTGSMLERSLRVMTQTMSHEPNDFEYFTSGFAVDGFGRCSPVGFCFVFPKSTMVSQSQNSC